MKKLRVAVLGLGLQGQRLIRAVEASKYAVLAATASEREPGSFEAVLSNKDVDAVIIASPNHKHAAHAIAAAKAGKHILCEKPLALSVREGRAIEAAVKKAGVQCFVNYHLRAHPDVLEAHRLIKAKKLGDIVAAEMMWAIGNYGDKKLPPLPAHMRWRESVQAGGGTTTTRGVHLFDLLRFITGQEIKVVAGWHDGTKMHVEHSATTLLELTNKAPVTLTTSKTLPGADNRAVIYGTKNKLELRNLFLDNPHDMYTHVVDYLAAALHKKKTPLATLKDGLAADTITEEFMRMVLGARDTSR